MFLTQAPIVVFNDADIESAVNGVAFASFIASGQTCVSGTRILVQDGVYDEFMVLFLHKVESIRGRMGDRALLFYRKTFACQ
jgi:acyl-CoA reductase-like NAD-dependent aldehyde dehydrogenase